MPDGILLDAGSFMDAWHREEPALIDVRSPAEFSHARIPGAVNLPLLDNEARHEVGITYRQKGHNAAVRKGFELAGPFFADLTDRASQLADGRNVFLYCWRGGLRSRIMSWLLGTAGQQVSILEGGYKAFRRWALEQFSASRQIIILGGKTGSGKTRLLHALHAAGEQTIDLEALAHHRGSAFGGLGFSAQPANEQFGNLLALAWHAADPGRPLWIENESRLIGTCLIPDQVYLGMRGARVVEIRREKQLRIKHILEEYGSFPRKKLMEKTGLVRKRLGGLRYRQALDALESGHMEEWCDILLSYYDRTYEYSNDQRDRDSFTTVTIDHHRPEAQVDLLIEAVGMMPGA